ncbi:MAG: ThiF family adenylyltransferase [Candidatus Thorarchaeota archaeon]|jgi:hypothetical protein
MQSRCPYVKNLPPPDLPNHSVIKIVGLGGVGSIVARYLSVYLAALNRPIRLVLIDGDDFEPSNAARQLFSTLGPKSAVVYKELTDKFLETQLDLDFIHCYVRPDNVKRFVHEGDIVLAALDNHKTRKLLTEHLSALDDGVLISGGNDGAGEENGQVTRGTMGGVQIHIRHEKQDISPALTVRHPEIANPADKSPHELDCMEAMASHPQLLFANLAVASSMLNTFLLYVSGEALHYSETSFDIADAVMRPLFPIEKHNG